MLISAFEALQELNPENLRLSSPGGFEPTDLRNGPLTPEHLFSAGPYSSKGLDYPRDPLRKLETDGLILQVRQSEPVLIARLRLADFRLRLLKLSLA